MTWRWAPDTSGHPPLLDRDARTVTELSAAWPTRCWELLAQIHDESPTYRRSADVSRAADLMLTNPLMPRDEKALIRRRRWARRSWRRRMRRYATRSAVVEETRHTSVA